MSDPNTLLDEATLTSAAQLNVYDAQGKKVKFGSIYAENKTVVVFIRHFLCGNCQSYVTALAQATAPETLKTANVHLAVVGCGDPGFIREYAERTGFHGAMYADPDRKVFRALDMNIETLDRTPAGQEPKKYLPQGNIVTRAVGGITVSGTTLRLRRRELMLRDVAASFQEPVAAGKQGKISQLGGEFILGPGNVCTFASRMKHTEDHVEVDELLKHAGIGGV
ncbi:AhpC/TSA antioxidant enzyme-domain-containing protein [Schizophyllum commune]